MSISRGIGKKDVVHMCRASLVAQMVKNLPTMQKTQVWSLGLENTLDKGRATLSSIFAWRSPWMGEPGRLQAMGSQKSWTHIYMMECYSAIKNKTMPFAATWMNLEIVILSKLDRERQLSYIACKSNLNNDTNELIYTTEMDSQT